jgi:hypothetical protein
LEKIETKYGILIIAIGVWFLFDGIFNIIYNFATSFLSGSWQSILILLVFPIINVIIGILGFTAGLLIYKGNLKGELLALISGIIGLIIVSIQGIWNFYFLYYLGFPSPMVLIESFSTIGNVIESFLAPTLLLIAGIKKISLKLGILIIIMGVFIITSYEFWLLMEILIISIEGIILVTILIIVGILGIWGGLSIKRGLSKGFKLSLLAGIIGIGVYSIIVIINIYERAYIYISLPLIINWAINGYQFPTIFLIGGLLARKLSTNTWINPGFSIDDRMRFT